MMGNGLHLLVDGLARQKLSQRQVLDFVCYMPQPEYLDMQIIEGPDVRWSGKGWVGWCIIAESHVSIHTNGIEVHTDIFSCKPFDPDKVLDYCREELGLEQMRHEVIHRGWAALGVS